MKKLRWQDIASLVLGAWVAASPWVLGIADEMPTAMWNALAVGILIALIAAIDLDTPAAWEEWVLGALGLWLVVAPWVLGYASHRTMMASSVASGALVLALAAWALYAAGDLPHRRDTTAH